MGLGDCIFDSIDNILGDVAIYYDSKEEFVNCKKINHIVITLLKLTTKLDWPAFEENCTKQATMRTEHLAKEIIEDFSNNYFSL